MSGLTRGLVVVVSGPSGVGKSTVLGAVLAQVDGCMFSISATTRAPRPGEVDGVHYFFYTERQFRAEVEAGEFLEWAEFCVHLYGTPRAAVVAAINAGRNVILDIETHGAAEVKAKLPESVSVFILPPSLEELTRRICSRGTEDARVVRARLDSASEQLRAASSYDYLVVNDSVGAAANKIGAVILAESCRSVRIDVSSLLEGVGHCGEHDEAVP